MKCRVMSFYITGYHSAELLSLHTRIMEKFLPQGCCTFQSTYSMMVPDGGGYINHGENIDQALASLANDEVGIIFEADAIPLNNWVITSLFGFAALGGLAGAAHCACHIDKNEFYASPAAFAIRGDVYNRVGCPSAIVGRRGDTNVELTRACRAYAVPIHLYTPIDSCGDYDSGYAVYNGGRLGVGCTYDVGIFHAFGSYPREKLLTKYRKVLTRYETH